MARLFRRVALAGVLFAVLTATSAATVSAHSNLFIWKYKNAACYSDGMAARGIIIEQGSTGTTWMRITARFQRLVNGNWQTTQSHYVQSSSQFPDNHDDHKLASTFSFYNASADYSNWTRISFKYVWFNDTHKLQSKTLQTGRC